MDNPSTPAAVQVDLPEPVAEVVSCLRAMLSLVRREAPHLSGKLFGQSDAALAAIEKDRATRSAPNELHAIMEGNAWRSALMGLCQGHSGTFKTPELAAENVRRRLPSMGRSDPVAQPDGDLWNLIRAYGASRVDYENHPCASAERYLSWHESNLRDALAALTPAAVAQPDVEPGWRVVNMHGGRDALMSAGGDRFYFIDDIESEVAAVAQPSAEPGLSMSMFASKADYLAAAGTVGEPATPSGWKLVPIEPTDAMLDEGHGAIKEQHDRGNGQWGECGGTSWSEPKEAWKAMLAAAPEAHPAPQEPAEPSAQTEPVVAGEVPFAVTFAADYLTAYMEDEPDEVRRKLETLIEAATQASPATPGGDA